MPTIDPALDALRPAISAATRISEAQAILPLRALAQLDAQRTANARDLARQLVLRLRATRSKSSGVDALMREFSLSSQEGVALMCLAEALLRIPDSATADALIRDKISRGDWRAHIGKSQSAFVNAAAWGLMLTGQLMSTHSEQGLSAALTRLIAKGGEPLIRKGVDLAMRLLGQQFVMGETIEQALARAEEFEARGYRYSYDMLGEAALTAADAQRYFAAYEQALQAIGAASAGRGVIEGPGISVKLSALHPRYSRAQRERVMTELLPRLRALCLLAKRYDIGLNIDAEESERLELSLDLIEALLNDPALDAWQGLGVVVQAYQKRCPFVIDWLVAAARAKQRRMMVRLVKGAYWDSEIKRAQVEGQSDYPVYTRKSHTDVSYLACARKLLAATDVIYPQFATHNALTLAAVVQMAEEERATAWEFQCLHGMGESLYDQVVGAQRLNRTCRIYAPVGSHETLLAYLVRRLLENGANSSFVHQIVDDSVSVDALLRDPVQALDETRGLPHPQIALPVKLFGEVRRNSGGLDLNHEPTLTELQHAFAGFATQTWRAEPLIAAAENSTAVPRAITNPARRSHIVGHAIDADQNIVNAALIAAHAFAPHWASTPAAERAAMLDRAADLLEMQRDALLWLAVHEAGKTIGNAVGEVREAIDFCRYYAAQIRAKGFDAGSAPFGPIAAISPWNFPLAIFIGQISGALAAGNVVLAKPAEQTPLIAAFATQLLHQAGVPRAALQLLPGDGRVGAQLVADARVQGVVFTGSTEVAALIDRTLAQREQDDELALIAETGGQNALIVDSSALPEQVVQDALTAAFDSAGQRCSALRVLCLQEDIADHVLQMLLGAMNELRVGDPSLLETDVGPVIDAEGQALIEAHVLRMQQAGARVHRLEATPSLTPTPLPGGEGLKQVLCFPLPPGEGPRVRDGIGKQHSFITPTVIEINSLQQLQREVFGPVLHVLRYKRDELSKLIDAINATGYGLTLGIHSRIDETINFIVERARMGNVYVNRNQIGAVVGVQPFGGEGLSGTGPKAGGSWYVPRLRRGVVADAPTQPSMALPGPTGESNVLRYHPRGRVLCLAPDAEELQQQLVAVFATGNAAVVQHDRAIPKDSPTSIERIADWRTADVQVVLTANAVDYAEARRVFSARDGARVHVLRKTGDQYSLRALLAERVVTVNTAAAGGNASLMTLSD